MCIMKEREREREQPIKEYKMSNVSLVFMLCEVRWILYYYAYTCDFKKYAMLFI